MYSVFLGDMELPIAPDKITTKIKNKDTVVTLVNEGDVNILKKAGLTDVSFTMRVPHNPLPFARNLQSVEYYLNKLENFKNGRAPIQFITVRNNDKGQHLYDSNLKVSLEDYNIVEDAKVIGMTNIEISLRQYRDFGEVIATVVERNVTPEGGVAQVQVEKARLDTKPVPRTYTVKQGDTLWKIAKKELGDGSRYPEIAKLNNIADPNRISIGQVLRLE